MPNFTIVAQNPKTNEIKEFIYNSEKNVITHEGKSVIENEEAKWEAGWNWNEKNPSTKVHAVNHLKISLGLSCNYSCSYCSQRFIPNAEISAFKKVNEFLEKMPTWYKGGTENDKIEFWGGEPFVYWKALKPLAEGIRKLYPKVEIGMVTNGTLLDDEKIDFLDKLDFGIGLSHDGVGYHIRGADPLEDKNKKEMIMKLYNRLKPKNKISINAMLHKDNLSRGDIQEFLVKYFGEDMAIGEGGFIDAYDAGGLSSSLNTPEIHIQFRRKALDDIMLNRANNFGIVHDKIDNFINGLIRKKPKVAVTQKCGIDDPRSLTVDLEGNVITCQNVSSVATAPNTKSHKGGSVYDFDNIKIETIRTWQNRKNCSNCPVLHLCQGSCTFLEGKLWDYSCDNSYSDNIVFLAVAIWVLTGFLPIYVKGQPHRPDREDIWGIDGLPKMPNHNALDKTKPTNILNHK